jgi:hypothetical protein
MPFASIFAWDPAKSFGFHRIMIGANDRQLAALLRQPTVADVGRQEIDAAAPAAPDSPEIGRSRRSGVPRCGFADTRLRCRE